jgi:hypothetical protein
VHTLAQTALENDSCVLNHGNYYLQYSFATTTNNDVVFVPGYTKAHETAVHTFALTKLVHHLYCTMVIMIYAQILVEFLSSIVHDDDNSVVIQRINATAAVFARRAHKSEVIPPPSWVRHVRPCDL